MKYAIVCQKVLVVTFSLTAVLCCGVDHCQAQLSQQPKRYSITIALELTAHQQFTPLFVQQLEEQLTSLVARELNGMARIQVTRTHPLLQNDKRLASVADEIQQQPRGITHFVKIYFSNGYYYIETKKYDGFTNQIIPVSETAHTTHRELIPRITASLLMSQFGLNGIVIASDGDNVSVQLVGVSDKTQWSSRLQVGDIFAVSKAQELGPRGIRVTPIDWALLQVMSIGDDGKISCRYYCRYQEDANLVFNNSQQIRVLQLPVKPSPLSLQFVSESPTRNLEGVHIHICRNDYGNTVREVPLDNNGMVQTKDRFDKMVLVRVVKDNHTIAQFPVAMLGNQLLTCRIGSLNSNFSDTQIRVRYQRWLRRLYDDLSTSSVRIGVLNEALERSPQNALDLAKRGRNAMEMEIGRLRQEELALVQEAQQAQVTMDFGTGKNLLRELENKKSKLSLFIDNLETVIQKNETTRKVETLLARVALLERQAKYPEAIQLYQQALSDYGEHKELQSRLATLKTAWEVKNDKHRQAREFIYQDWSETLDLAALQEKISQAKNAFLECKRNQDRLSPRKMISATLNHASYLKKRLEVLARQRLTEDNRADQKRITELGEQLEQLYADITAWVEKGNAN